MRILNITVAVISLLSLFFLVYATAYSSKPQRFKQRALEFGLYFLATITLAAMNIPPASAVALTPPSEIQSYLPALRSMISSVALIRIGALMLYHYGQRIGLQKRVSELEQQIADLTALKGGERGTS